MPTRSAATEIPYTPRFGSMPAMGPLLSVRHDSGIRTCVGQYRLMMADGANNIEIQGTDIGGDLPMLMRTDPFREFDRLAQQMFGSVGTAARPAVMPMDAWREGDEFVVQFDLPGVSPESLDLALQDNVLTVKAERPLSQQTKDFL